MILYIIDIDDRFSGPFRIIITNPVTHRVYEAVDVWEVLKFGEIKCVAKKDIDVLVIELAFESDCVF